MGRRMVIGLILGAAALGTPESAPAQQLPRAHFVLYHVAGSKGEKPLMPRELKKFANQLKVVGNRFRLLGKKNKKKPIPITLQVGMPLTLQLPDKLGRGQIMLELDGSVKVTLIPQKPKNPRDRFVGKHGRFPIFLVDPQKIKTPKEHYLFILEKVPPPKKKK